MPSACAAASASRWLSSRPRRCLTARVPCSCSKVHTCFGTTSARNVLRVGNGDSGNANHQPHLHPVAKTSTLSCCVSPVGTRLADGGVTCVVRTQWLSAYRWSCFRLVCEGSRDGVLAACVLRVLQRVATCRGDTHRLAIHCLLSRTGAGAGEARRHATIGRTLAARRGGASVVTPRCLCTACDPGALHRTPTVDSACIAHERHSGLALGPACAMHRHQGSALDYLNSRYPSPARSAVPTTLLALQQQVRSLGWTMCCAVQGGG